MINIWKAKGGKNMSIVYNLDVRCHEMLKYLLYQDGYTIDHTTCRRNEYF